jgi:hypothetical protein
MHSSCKKYTCILGLVSLIIITASCSTASEKKNEISHQNQTQKASSNPAKLKNDDGFLITSLPYSSNAHLNCILSAQRMNCGSINLIDSVGLIKVYNFMNPSYGDSVVFPETSAGVLLIASPQQVKGNARNKSDNGQQVWLG